MAHAGWSLPLFVPATRPDRFAKAARSGADAIVVDLEDAVPAAEKAGSRRHVAQACEQQVEVLLRVNAHGTAWYEDDCNLAASLPVAGVVLPKVESAEQVAATHRATGGKPILALIESVAGLERLADVAASTGIVQLGFGTQDLAGELGCSPGSALFDTLRCQLLLASRRRDIAPPIDGVSLLIDDPDGLAREGVRLVEIGFAGRFCIHPAQVAPLRRGLLPTPAQVAQAIAVVGSTDGVARVGGLMVDAPVRTQARRLLAIYERFAQSEMKMPG